MNARDEYRRTAFTYFVAAEGTDNPDTINMLLASAQGYVRSAAIETANHHTQAWHDKVLQLDRILDTLNPSG